MKFYFRLFVAWLLLFSLWSLASVQSITVEDFNSIWNNGLSNVCYSGGNVVTCSCTDGNAVRWCVREAKKSVGNFDNQWDVQVRKLVRPTPTLWIYDVHIWIIWKKIAENSLKTTCSVVLFDTSASMRDCLNIQSDWSCVSWNNSYYDSDHFVKWNSAVSWAIQFSQIVYDSNPNSKVWLWFFDTTGRDSAKQWIIHKVFDAEDFSWELPLSWFTNLHHWLIKAGDFLQSTDGCDIKNLVIMTDWAPTEYRSWGRVHDSSGTNYAIAKQKAIDEAEILRENGIVIYTVWYEIFWSGAEMLREIAWTSANYYDASISDMSEKFQEVWERVEPVVDAWDFIDIEDNLWDNMTWLSSPWKAASWDAITEIGMIVYSGQIRIKDSIPWFHNSNSWLILRYRDSYGDIQTLSILPSDTAQIYWANPKCEWPYPSGTSVVTWSDEFVQNWNWTALTPPTKTWTYTDNVNPWECEWTCSGTNYVWNTIMNTCELVSESVTVTFDPNGWKPPVIPPVVIESWENLTGGQIPSPIKTWYILTWWTLTCDGDDFFIIPSVVTWDITLCAKWEPNTYTVVFSWNGSTNWTMPNQVFTYDVTWNLNNNQYGKEWFDFVEWNTKADWSGTWYENQAEVKNLAITWTVTLYAIWSQNTYDVRFNKNGWDGSMGNQHLTYGVTWNLNLNQFVRTWYHFTWWNTQPNGNGTKYANGAEVFNLATTWVVDLYAQWEPNKYTIVFSWNKSTNWTMPNQTLTYDATWTLNPNEFGRIWYIFTWWNTKLDWTWTWFIDGDTVKNLATWWQIVLYAQRQPNKYTIVFSWNWSSNGTMWNQQLTYDVAENLHANQYGKVWFNFVEWNTKKDGSWTWYANGALVKNLAITWVVTLYAQWNANTYEVEFNKNATDATWTMLNQTIPYDETKKLTPNAFNLVWYHFAGWNRNPDWTGTWYLNEAEVKNLATTWVVKLYAQWEPNNYTIIFDWNGASAWTMAWLEMTYNQEKPLTSNNYTRNWYKFLWWNSLPDGKWTGYTDGQVVKNLATEWEVRLYAQWEKLWSSWWWGWWGCIKDDCPDGDYSWNRCDGKCWKKPEPEPDPDPDPTPWPTPWPTPNPVIPDKKCLIEWSKHSAEVNEAYIWACQRWIIKSQTITWAKLWEFLNRAEMAKITTVFEMLELWSQPNRNKDCSAFADSMSWYNQEMKNYMITSCQLERMWIHTADYTPIPDFMPRKFVSRAEFGTILSRILWWDKYEAEKNSRYYYVDHLNKLKAAWILTDINPNLVERRSYAILMIYRAAKMMWMID